MSREHKRSAALMESARRVIPGGVNSPVRAFRGVGGEPISIARGEDAFLFDVDGNAYLDYVCAWGPLILGHAHPRVVSAIRHAAVRGTAFGATTEAEVSLAERIVGAVPSVERVRLVNSGTEATMSALRLARAATGREKVLKFVGCYHGHVDSLLVQAGSGVATMGIPDSPGVTKGTTADTVTVPYNDLSAVEHAFDELGDDLAAVIVEPIAGNMGVVLPAPGFLEGLRQLTEQHGALLIFDEVITGFRVGPGGAQGRLGVTPDLTCLGKIIGGGLPVGAFGGRADLMEQLAPTGPVYQAGTLAGNPLAAVAGEAMLDVLQREQPYDELERCGARLEQGLKDAAREAGVKVAIPRMGSLLSIFFGSEETPTHYGEVTERDGAAYARFFHEMLERGVYLAPSPYECAFLSTRHDDEVIDQTIEAAREAFREVAAGSEA